MESYAEKMGRKSLAELYLYVQKREEYREDAVLAALDELDHRGEFPAEAAGIRQELAPIVREQQEAARQQAAQANLEPTTVAYAAAEGEGPALYSPGTIVLFSMLFSFLAGGILLVLNMFRLKESGKALRLVAFILGFLVAASFGLQWLVGQFGPQMQFFGVGVNFLAVLIYLLYFWPRYVGPRPYVSRQWLPPLLVCLLLFYVLVKLAAPYLAKLPH